MGMLKNIKKKGGSCMIQFLNEQVAFETELGFTVHK